MRLIDADEIKSPNVVIFEMPLFGKMEPVVRLEEIKKYMPTVDAQPVVHGKWKYTSDVRVLVSCSECGRRYDVRNISPAKFCPNCGADMRGGKDA